MITFSSHNTKNWFEPTLGYFKHRSRWQSRISELVPGYRFMILQGILYFLIDSVTLFYTNEWACRQSCEFGSSNRRGNFDQENLSLSGKKLYSGSYQGFLWTSWQLGVGLLRGAAESNRGSIGCVGRHLGLHSAFSDVGSGSRGRCASALLVLPWRPCRRRREACPSTWLQHLGSNHWSDAKRTIERTFNGMPSYTQNGFY